MTAIPCDAADPVQVREAVRQAEAAVGLLTVLVCNAGIAQSKLFTDLTDEKYNYVTYDELTKNILGDAPVNAIRA